MQERYNSCTLEVCSFGKFNRCGQQPRGTSPSNHFLVSPTFGVLFTEKSSGFKSDPPPPEPNLLLAILSFPALAQNEATTKQVAFYFAQTAFSKCSILAVLVTGLKSINKTSIRQGRFKYFLYDKYICAVLINLLCLK